MSTETNKAIVRRYIEQVLNEQRHDLVEEFLTENIELHGSGIPPGLEVVKQWFSTYATAFPDGRTIIEDVVAEDDRVVARTTFNGTHQAEIEGIPATGKKVSMPGITIFRLDNGKIAEGWLVSDNLGMMQQLGVIPRPQEN
ncbi:MAG: ester cyclase [Anaerolineales bacterium]